MLGNMNAAEPRPIGLLNDLNASAQPLGLVVLHDGATPVETEDGTKGLFRDWRFKISELNPNYDVTSLDSAPARDNQSLRGLTADQVRDHLARAQQSRR